MIYQLLIIALRQSGFIADRKFDEKIGFDFFIETLCAHGVGSLCNRCPGRGSLQNQNLLRAKKSPMSKVFYTMWLRENTD